MSKFVYEFGGNNLYVTQENTALDMLIRATRYNSVWLKTKEVIGNKEKKIQYKNSCNYKITNKLIYEKQ